MLWVSRHTMATSPSRSSSSMPNTPFLSTSGPPPALTAFVVNTLGRKSKALKEGDPNLQGDYVREGLGAVITVQVPSP